MINLSISGNSIIFEFQDNQHYLNNGTIEVPVNSLTLVTDESNMATFKKSASNDIFLSCLYSELGMTKAELEAFYKENMVGGGGVDPADVLDIVESATSYYDGVEYDSVNSRINFKHGNTIEGYIDAAPFIVDGMVDNVAISGGNLVITFNTDSGKQPISIPLTDIFDPSNYYNKTAIDTIISGVNDSIIEDEEVISSALNDLNERKLDASAYTPTDLTNYYTSAQTESAITAAVSGKQDTLVAGDNITISGNVISADGGGGSASSAITSGDTNPVQGGVLYDKFDEVESVTAAALNLLNTNMGGLKFVKLSQQEYDDLAVKDSSTMYVII